MGRAQGARLIGKTFKGFTVGSRGEDGNAQGAESFCRAEIGNAGCK